MVRTIYSANNWWVFLVHEPWWWWLWFGIERSVHKKGAPSLIRRVPCWKGHEKAFSHCRFLTMLVEWDLWVIRAVDFYAGMDVRVWLHIPRSRFCGSLVGSGDHFIDWENYSEMMVGGRYRLLFCEGHVLLFGRVSNHHNDRLSLDTYVGSNLKKGIII